MSVHRLEFPWAAPSGTPSTSCWYFPVLPSSRLCTDSVPFQLGRTWSLPNCSLPYQVTFICIEVIKSAANCLMGASNSGALVTIGLIIDFNFVSSLKEQYVMLFVCCLMSLPFAGNLWEYYQVTRRGSPVGSIPFLCLLLLLAKSTLDSNSAVN